MARRLSRRVIRELRERQALEEENRLLRDRLAREEQERQSQRQGTSEQQAEEHGLGAPTQDSPDSGEGRWARPGSQRLKKASASGACRAALTRAIPRRVTENGFDLPGS